MERPPFRVLIAGGGVAGVEALLALHRHLGDRAELTLLAPEEHFSYRPLAVAEPFSLGHAEQVPLTRIAQDAGARLIAAAVERVDAERRRVRTSTGAVLEYDALLLAIGGRPVEAVEHATTWWPGGDPEHFGGLLRDLEEGYTSKVAFVIPPGAVWPLPAYELALMTSRQAAGMNQAEVEITVVTPEEEPLELFGARAGQAVREELSKAGVGLRTGVVAEVRPGTVRLVPGDEELAAGRVVAIPRITGPELQGVPRDDDGFVLVDAEQRVRGVPDVWAAGDGTSFPVKHGGLATHQARRAVAGIARAAGGEAPEEPETAVLRGVLMTGAHPRGLDDQARESPDPVRFWAPAGKVDGTYLPGYLREAGLLGATPEPESAAEGAVVVEEPVDEAKQAAARRVADLRRAWQLSPEQVERLGRRMHDVEREHG